MYLRDLLRSLGRRWYFVVLGLAVTAGLGSAAFVFVPVSYTSEASLLLLPPDTSTQPSGNPFLYLGGLSQAVDVLTRSVGSDASTKPLLAAHPGAKFTIAADTTTTGPIILVKSTAPTAARASEMTAAILVVVPQVLDTIQSDLAVKTESQMSIMAISVDRTGTLDAKTRLQAIIGVGAAGIVLTIIVTGLLDGLLGSRKRRRRKSRRQLSQSTISSRVRRSPS